MLREWSNGQSIWRLTVQSNHSLCSTDSQGTYNILFDWSFLLGLYRQAKNLNEKKLAVNNPINLGSSFEKKRRKEDEPRVTQKDLASSGS